MILAGLLGLSPAQSQTISRGGTLKCANNLPDGVSATASLAWVENGVPITGGQVFSCDATANQQDRQLVLQPANANGWSLTISITASYGFSGCSDNGAFAAGGMPHIRLRCASPDGGAVTFFLSRNP